MSIAVETFNRYTESALLFVAHMNWWPVAAVGIVVGVMLWLISNHSHR